MMIGLPQVALGMEVRKRNGGLAYHGNRAQRTLMRCAARDGEFGKTPDRGRGRPRSPRPRGRAW
jgi:hypothetical protein